MSGEWILYAVYAVAGLLFLGVAYLLGYRNGFNDCLHWRRIPPRLRGE